MEALDATTSTATGLRGSPGHRAMAITAPVPTRATLATTSTAMEEARTPPTASPPVLANSTEQQAHVVHCTWHVALERQEMRPKGVLGLKMVQAAATQRCCKHS